MRIVLLCAMATTLRAYDKGEQVDWPDAKDAQRLIDAGYARRADADEAPHRRK